MHIAYLIESLPTIYIQRHSLCCYELLLTHELCNLSFGSFTTGVGDAYNADTDNDLSHNRPSVSHHCLTLQLTFTTLFADVPHSGHHALRLGGGRSGYRGDGHPRAR